MAHQFHETRRVPLPRIQPADSPQRSGRIGPLLGVLLALLFAAALIWWAMNGLNLAGLVSGVN